MNNETTAADSYPPVERPARQHKGTVPAKHGRKRDLKRALSHAALAFARQLKREFRALYEADPKAFRAVVQKAQARIFRLKPGPKQDERIAQAARERARGIPWPELYAKHIDRYSTATEFYRALLEAGFQRKVNHYLQRHPSIRRLGHKVTLGDASTKRLPPVLP